MPQAGILARRRSFTREILSGRCDVRPHGFGVARQGNELLIVAPGLRAICILFTIIVVTWVIQIGSYQLWYRRVFRMVPLHHHFELAGWSEVNIVVRFWIIAGLGVASALGLFYADTLRVTELGLW